MKVLFSGKILMAAVAGLFLLGGVPQVVMALNGVCPNCHTMHNSQDNHGMPTALAHPTPTAQLLTANNCIGCHTGSNDASHKYYVNSSTGTPGANILAGGSFWWVDPGGGNDTTKGHNLSYLGGADTNLATAPGSGGTVSSPLTCAGTTGCHGLRAAVGDAAAMSGSHHGNLGDARIIGAATDPLVPGSPGTAYRFLDGIEGYEDSNREYNGTLSPAQHNQYKGVSRTSSADAAGNHSTISYLCAECHPNFHYGANNIISGTAMNTGLGSWLRHPTDFDMWTVRAKPDYNGISTAANSYDTLTPVGSVDVSAIRNTFMGTAADTTIVTCISCHRAHGSANADLLRWDYSTCVVASGAAGANCGCFRCHTTKD